MTSRSSRGARRLRRALAASVLAVWGAVLAWHVRREYGVAEPARLAEAAARLSPSAAYYAVRMAGTPVGFAASNLDTIPGGFLLTDELRLFLQVLGRAGEARARTEMELSPGLALRRFRFGLDSELGRFYAEGFPEGDSALQIRVRAGDDDQELRIPIRGPILLPGLLPLRLVIGGEPQVGKSYALPVFDPSAMDSRTVELQVVAREHVIFPDSAVYDSTRSLWVPVSFDTVWAWRVVQTFGGVRVESWLDPEGHVVRAESPLGFVMERTAFEIAWNNVLATARAGGRRTGAPDIIQRTAVASNVPLERIEGMRRLGVRIRNVELEGLHLGGGRQRLVGDTLWIEREDVRSLEPGYVLPATFPEFREELAAEPLVQVDDPEIRAAAARIAGNVRDPVEAARRLTEWVYGALEKQVIFSVPSARQVLAGRKGDCNEHTVLYVALARALGLPARTAAGLVYVHGRFYYHAWPEVWLGRWVAVDPTFGQFPADAAHLRFVIGGLADQVMLLRLIGRVGLDVVEVTQA
ncbi:MAG: transglutaminase domain-containing protein [Gemmatimonadetes bacterium]|nr:transglutaminase domain-containing protein [Gemmatimonadota bacterium]